MYALNDVTRTYRSGRQTVRALDGLDLAIADGEFLAVRGRTGSGKTTLLQLLGALDRPTSGTVEFAGRDLAGMPDRQLTDLRARSIGFVFQTFNLIPTLTALENVQTALVPLGVPAADRVERAEQALRDVGLADRATHLPTELSGGQQQRVGIARALVKQPEVLLADEPTGNLDEDTRDEIIALLENLWAARGLTLVLVTHDAAVADRARRVAVLEAGRCAVPESPRG